MASIVPIPTTRVSNLLVRQRLLTQLQGDQLDMFRLQNQVSTGRRITLPSDDAPAAQRAISLQRLLERKGQLRSNIESGQAFLSGADDALNDVASDLGDLRGAALGVNGATTSEADRQAVKSQIDQVIESLLATANTQFLGRYLFAGSQTNVPPYGYDGQYVRYSGNNELVNNYSDLGLLFSTNAPGDRVFGGISSQVVGGVDLDPHMSADTLLSSLRNGRGISPNGAVQISDGANAVIVDLSRAVTVGDVVRLFEENPPAGRQVTANITGQGLTLQLDAAGGGNLTIAEVASGKAASELGILETIGVGTATLAGRDLDPIILRTTRLEDLLGSKARTRLISSGANNDLLIEAAANGAAFSGVTVQLVDDELLSAGAGVTAGNEFAQFDAAARAARASLRFSGGGNDLTLTAATPGTSFNNVRIVVAGQTGLGDAAVASYDPATKRLTITVDDAGATTIASVVSAVNAEGTFNATHDASVEAAQIDSSLIAAADIGSIQGDTGNSGGAAGTLYIYVDAGVSNANQVAAAINEEGTFTAEVDRADTDILAQAGTGPVDIASTATTSGGGGGSLDLASGLKIVNGGSTHTLDFSIASTVQEFLNVFNSAEYGLHAELNADGTGINVRSRLSGGDFQIGENGGQLATQLGIRTFTGATRLDDLNYGVGVPTNFDSYLAPLIPPPVSYPDFTIVADNGAGGTVDLVIDIHQAATVEDVLDLINNHPLNNTGGVAVVARLSGTGGGVELVDSAARPITIQAAPGSPAAEYLGLIPAGTTSVTNAGGVIAGTDRKYLETPSVFNTLLRLRDALEANDAAAMGRAIATIDVDLDRITFERSELGAQQQALDVSQTNLEDEDVQLRTALSDEIEVDLVEAISNLTARQVSLQASLQAMGNMLQLTLLNYL